MAKVRIVAGNSLKKLRPKVNTKILVLLLANLLVSVTVLLKLYGVI